MSEEFEHTRQHPRSEDIQEYRKRFSIYDFDHRGHICPHKVSLNLVCRQCEQLFELRNLLVSVKAPVSRILRRR